MRLFAVFALFTALAWACGTPARVPSGLTDPYTSHPRPFSLTVDTPVYLDAGFTDSELDSVHMALAEWNRALNGYQRFDVRPLSWSAQSEGEIINTVTSSLEGIVIYRVTLEYPAAQDVDRHSPGVLAWAAGGSIFVIAERVGTRDLRAILLHEIGHVLGLEHSSTRFTIMWPHYDAWTPCIDPLTVQALAAKREWRAENMNWCEG